MDINKIILALWFVLLSTLPAKTAWTATLHYSGYDWYTMTSSHFYIHYHEGLEEIARETLSLAETVHTRLSKKLEWEPVGRTHVVLTDEYDFSNGFATPFPNNFTTIFITPPDDLITLEDHAGWIETVFTHEYTHVLHLDKVDGPPETLRRILGRHLLTFPNIFQPRWLTEGYATYIETDRKRGIGRGQSSLYEGMMRAELLGGFKPLKQVNNPMATWPSGTAAYLYGVFWHEFIDAKYGAEQITWGIKHHSDNLLPFSINATSESTYGKTLLPLWNDFYYYMEEKFQPQFKEIRARGVIEGERLTNEGYYTGPLKTLPTGEVYYISYNGEREPMLMRINRDKSIEHLADVHFGARLDVHPRSGILLSQFEYCGAGQLYVDLYRMDLDGDDVERITECGRYRNAVWSPDGKEILAVKYERGITELHLLDEWGKFKQKVWQGKRWEVVGSLDWSPVKNELMAAVYREQGGWNLEKFDMEKRQWSYVLKDSAIVGFPQYTHDGRFLLFTSEHGKVYNIRRLDTRTGKIETITNVLTGALSPVQTAAGDLFYIGYTSDGLDVFRLASSDIKPSPLPKAAKGTTGVPLATPAAVQPESIEEYSAWDSLKPAWWMPWIYSDDDRTEISLVTAGYDSLLQHLYGVVITYDDKNEWWSGQLSYIYDALFPTIRLDVTRQHEFIREDESGTSTTELRHTRRTTDQMLEVIFPFRGVSSGWTFNMAAIKHEEKGLFTAEGVTPKADVVDNVAGMALVYDSVERPVKSVSRTQGREISIVLEDSDVISGSDYAGQVYWGDWREFIRLGGQHVLAARYVEGHGEERTRPFKLGGSYNNESLSNSVSDPVYGSPFKKRSYNLRGYPEGLSQLTNQNMRLATLEYRFPIYLHERGGMAPPFGMHQLHANVFVEGGGTWDTTQSGPEKIYRSYGLEVNFDVSVFYFGIAQISIGAAEGIDEGGETKVYIRGGASF